MNATGRLGAQPGRTPPLYPNNMYLIYLTFNPRS